MLSGLEKPNLGYILSMLTAEGQQMLIERR
uniref:Uncharacterized protein n=1 Tax=Podoviridae sp. ct8dV2 TaxID=2825222 RepID=A0A8S5PQ19_9CAUD|nr:MAG TPA: hypothetical protein [Podoviridae sp. ct8dV2]